MKLKMHDEIIRMEISQKMLELTTHSIAFSPMKRKFNSNNHFRPRITTTASSRLLNTEQRNIGECEDEDDDSRASSTLMIGNGVLVKSDMKITNDINLPSPPSSTRSSFDGKESFLSTDEVVMDTEDSHISSIEPVSMSNESNDLCEEQLSDDPNTIKDSFDDDIKLVVEYLVNSVSDSVDKADDEDLWKDIYIDPDGVTILPNGTRVVYGVADLPFYRENDTEPLRFTNQLNYLKTILTKYICRYKTAMPFLRPVDCVQFKIPHYYQVVRNPMDFNTVKNRINFHWYRSAKECISDIQLIFSNCYLFNSPTDYVYSAGKKLEEYFDDKLKDMPPTEVEIPCPPRPNIDEIQKLCERKNKRRPDSISDKRDSVDSVASGGTPTFAPIKMTTRSERGVMVRKPSKDLPTPISTPQPRTPTLKKVPLNEPMKFWYDFIKELFTKKHMDYAWPFYKPVSIEDYPDYLQKIKKPMDLTTIKQNIEIGKYVTVNDFAKDMRLMFSNCLRYNTQDSPVIEQARKLREQFEFKYARIPEEWLSQKMVIPKSRTTSPSVRNNSASSSNSHLSRSDSHHKSKKCKINSDNKKGLNKNRSSMDTIDSGQQLLSSLSKLNGTSADNDEVPSVERMKLLEMQVKTLTSVLTATLLRNSAADSNQAAIINSIANSSTPNGNHGTGRSRVNGQRKRQTTKRQTALSKRKRHLSSEEEDSDDELNNPGDIGEPFDPEKIDDLKKLKNDLENLHAKDLQNVLRILQSTEPSLRCDDDSNVEIDFEALKPKTLVALRKYVTSCMLNAKASPTSQQPSASLSTPNNKKFCNSANSVRGNLDTDCDTYNTNNCSRAGSRASNLQLSESSSSDSEIDD